MYWPDNIDLLVVIDRNYLPPEEPDCYVIPRNAVGGRSFVPHGTHPTALLPAGFHYSVAAIAHRTAEFAISMPVRGAHATASFVQ